MGNYIEIENDLKNQKYLFREASLTDLSFHYMWALIGFYKRNEEGNYFERQKSILIDKKKIELNNIISNKNLNIKEDTQKYDKKILIFQSDRTQAIIDAMDNKKFMTQHKNNFLNPENKYLKITQAEYDELLKFYNSTVAIFERYNISLTDYDKSFLKDMLLKVILDYLQVLIKLSLNQNKISLIITHADNHPSPIYWVIAAKILRIPTFMTQHGLDCEPYFLEDSYADYIAVWGKNRKDRYETNSKILPREIRITGNPNYDKFACKPFQNIESTKSLTIGYIGRPHGIEKSYFGFRNPQLGKVIVNDLNEIAKKYPNIKIICKLHPYDDKTQYENIKLCKNIEFSNKSMEDFLDNVDVVFSEDSTSAVEALMYGKTLYLLNYEDTKTIVDIKSYNAGIVIKNSDELEQNIDMIMNHKIDFNFYINGRDRLLEDYIYKVDKNATKRVLDFIDDILIYKNNKTSELTVCSIVTASYLKYADALYLSLKNENPNTKYYVLVIDGKNVEKEQYGFKIIMLEELKIKHIEHMLMYYSAFELSCVLKPFFIKYLLLQKHQKVLFLDVDIYITASFYNLSKLLDSKDVVFTPHFNQSPPIDGHVPTDIHIVLYGVYNGGFWAFKNTNNAIKVLEWFITRFYVYGFHQPEKGMSGDQPLIPLAAEIFNDIFYSLKDPSYNTAYWNLHERDVIYKNGKFYVDKKEVVFFHLSGFKEDKPEVFSNKGMHYQRITTDRYPVTKDIIRVYMKYIEMANKSYENDVYLYNEFNGEKITPEFRNRYFQLVKDELYKFVNNSSKKDIVIITDLDFWNINQGSKARILSLVLYLKNNYNVKVLYIPKPRKMTKEDKNIIQSLSLENDVIDIESIPILHKTPYQKQLKAEYRVIKKFYDHSIANRFYTYIKTHNIDYCVFEYFNYTYLLDHVSDKTINILDTHDIVYLRAEKFKENNAKHWFHITKEQEFTLFRKYHYLLSIQKGEYKFLNKNGFKNQNILVPHGSILVKHIVKDTIKNIIFVAGRNDVNFKSIKWFLENIWIYYKQLFPNIALNIYGRVNQDLDHYKLLNVKTYGFVENYDDIYKHADIVINPVLFGGGLKIKSVEALCHSLPLVTTTEGASGMSDGVNKAMIVANNAEDFLDALIALTLNYDLRCKLSQNAYEYAQKHFSEDVAYKGLIEVIEKGESNE